MVAAVVNIREKNTVPLLGFIVAGLSSKYKKIVINLEQLPINLEKFLKENFKVKIRRKTGCNSFTHLLQISGIAEQGYSVEAKNNKLVIYLNSPKLTAEDIKIIKLSNLQNYSDIPVEGGFCRQLVYTDWIEGLEQSKYNWASLLYALYEVPFSRILHLIEQDSAYSKMFNFIQQRVGENNYKEIYFDNVNDFYLGLILLAIYNFLANKQIKINLANQLLCLPIFRQGQLSCIETKFSLHDYEVKMFEANQENGDNEGLDNLHLLNDNEVKEKTSQNKEANEESSVTKLDDNTGEGGKKENINHQAAENKVDSTESQNIATNTIEDNSSTNDGQEDSDGQSPTEIDVESWALRIQEMLDS